MSNYNLKLILLSMLIGYFAILLTFSLVSKLYKSETSTKNSLLFFSTFIVGSSFWAIHFLDVLAFPLLQSTGFILSDVIFSWFAALIIALTILDVCSKKTLPLESLVAGGFVAGISGFVMFYFSIGSMQIQPEIAFSSTLSLIAVIVSISAAMLGMMIIFWLKNYPGEFPNLTKSMFAIIMSVAINGVHFAHNAAIEIPHNAISNTDVRVDNNLLGITIALGLICLLLIAFVIAIFYDKLGHNTFKFSRFKKSNEQELTNLAMQDTLTQLPNRRAFQHHLESAIKRSSRGKNTIAIAYIDLDNFKPINDTYGHHIGDEVLLTIAKRLNAAVRGCDVISRIGGDEFVALIEEIKSEKDIVPIAERIVRAVREILIINFHQISLSASVGIAVYPRDGDIDKLLICADAAMYRAKSDGKNQFRFFDAEIELASSQILDVQKDLRTAIANNEFRLYFQPKVDTKTKALVGAEALIRWEHPIKGLIMPSAFIAAAEKFGLLKEINDWVIEEVCRTICRLQSHALRLNISINLTSQQFHNPNLVDEVKVILQRYRLPHNSLTFEITETAAIKNQRLFDALITKFSEAGINTAIDDFGTNPSSLAYLQNLKVDELKLDKQFIVDIGTNSQSRAVTDAIIRLAHALNFLVVAEGVETEAQRLALAELNCDQMQGYLFSHPLSEVNLITLMKQLNKFPIHRSIYH